MCQLIITESVIDRLEFLERGIGVACNERFTAVGSGLIEGEAFEVEEVFHVTLQQREL
jgi:hypothetical protein